MSEIQEELTGLRGEMGQMKAMLEVLVQAIATSFISPQDVADRLGIDRKTVLAHLNAGKIKGSKITGEWRIPATEILRLLQEAEGNHFAKPKNSTRLNNILLDKKNDSTTRKAKRKVV